MKYAHLVRESLMATNRVFLIVSVGGLRAYSSFATLFCLKNISWRFVYHPMMYEAYM